MSTPEPGSTLAGKYLVEEVLGVGGMGVVVAARHLQLDQKVAIKYLLPEVLSNPEVVERFAREAKAAARIRGEHVARVIDVGQLEDGAPYMVLEYLEGNDLAKELQSGPLAVEDAARYLLETCEALAEAHAAKIVHRDLKPSNLFLAKQPDRRRIIKVLDFGISKIGDTAAAAALTKTSALMGTAYYMSPEQLIAPKTIDHRSDIWSLGVILYELMSGEPPFPGESVPEIIAGILQNQPVPLREKRPDLPPGLDDVVAKCMKYRADDRYPSVAALAGALAPYALASDRASVEVTARVLGDSLRPHAHPPKPKPPEEPGAPTMLVSSQRASDDVPVPSAPVSVRVVTDAGIPPSQPLPAAAVTSQGGLTTAVAGSTGKRPSGLVLGLVAGGLAVGGLVAVLFLRDGKPAETPRTGIVATPSAIASAPPPLALPTPSAVASEAPVASASAPTAVAAAGTSVAVPPPVVAPVRPQPSAVSPRTVASTPTTPPPASASSGSKNPLQMGIK